MTVTPPPPPGSSSRRPLGFDEFIAILVAFLSIGSILFWVLGRGDRGFDLSTLQTPVDDGGTAIAPLILDPPARTLLPAPVSPTPGAVLPPRSVPAAPYRPGVAPQPAVPFVDPVPVPEAASPTPEPVSFNDVSSDYWAYPFIAALSQRGIISGFEDGNFRPDQSVTRAEFASMIERAFDQAEVERQAIAFNDVPADFWANDAIARAYEIGFMQGYPNNVFQPTQQIPRFQALIALANGLDFEPLADAAQILQSFEDANQAPDYATNLLAAATDTGLVVNYPNANQLRPAAEATRAEVAAFIYQAMAEAGQVEPIESPYIVQP